MKPSGAEWIGDIPCEWTVKPFFMVLPETGSSNHGLVESNLLSLSYGQIIRKDIESNDGLLPESFGTYQIVEPGELVFRFTDLQNDKRSLRSAVVRERGIITSAYLAASPVDCLPDYMNYLMRSYDTTKVFYSLGGGVRQSLKYADVKRIPVLVPPLVAQRVIVDYLNRETSQIDALLAKQERLIEVLVERRQAMITQAVTRGFNPAAPMKDSGVEWIGPVPQNWRLTRIKHLASLERGRFTHRPRNDPDFYDGPFPFVQTGDVARSGMYLTEFKQTLSDLGAGVSREFPAGTLVMTIAANVGDAAILGFASYFPDSVVGLLVRDDVMVEYLYYLILAMREPLVRNASINTQLNLNEEQIGSLPTVCPPPDEQLRIVAHLDRETAKIDALIDKAKQMNVVLRERRSALISAAVTGKIDVTKTKRTVGAA